MKRIILVISLISVICSCNSGKKKADGTKSDTEVGVENANGNIPDTTNAIKLSTDKKDSAGAHKDSVK